MKKQGVSPTNANVRKVIEANKVDNIVHPSLMAETVQQEFFTED